jgi:hypothetical protein
MPNVPKVEPFPIGCIEYHDPAMVDMIVSAHEATLVRSGSVCTLLRGAGGDLMLVHQRVFGDDNRPRLVIQGSNVIHEDETGSHVYRMSLFKRHATLGAAPDVFVQLTPFSPRAGIVC